MAQQKSQASKMHDKTNDASEDTSQQSKHFDQEAFAHNFSLWLEAGGHALSNWMRAKEDGKGQAKFSQAAAETLSALAPVMEYWFANPERSVQAQKNLALPFFDLWLKTLKQMDGQPVEAMDTSKLPIIDKRLNDPAWQENPAFNFMRQAFLLGANWLQDLVQNTDNISEHDKMRADFFARLLSSSVSPANFPLTNPLVIKETLDTNGENLVKGMNMLAEDIARGGGDIKVRQTDYSAFKIGENIATTPGKVIYRNDVMELIQYEPTTPKVLKRPLLIVPPWINKYYILDLNPEKSYVKWCVDQGLTVFLVSWVNPDERHAHKTFLDYIRESIFAALDVIREVTGEEKVSALGYCVGGTMLATALGLMAAKGDNRIANATLLTAQTDFADAGDLKVFIDESTVESIEAQMQEKGYLDAKWMGNAFNMMRPNDLIWPYITETYFKGKAPSAFDLLFWNSDSTRMPAANHSFYMRNFYLENKLSKGELELDREKIDLKKVRTPIFSLATKEDHIAPAVSVFKGAANFGSNVTFVLAASGHIAGVVNPPAKKKYEFWTSGKDHSSLSAWQQSATANPGSWWPYWMGWMKGQARQEWVEARPVGTSSRKPICDAPGTYVLVSG